MNAATMNLYGVTPLTACEMRAINGGVDPLTLLVVVGVAALLAGCATTPDKAEPASSPKQEPAPVGDKQATK